MIACLALWIPSAALADGGVVRVRQPQGPYIITVFSPNDVLANQPADLTVMVQRAQTGEVLMNAIVDVSVTPPAGAKMKPGDPFCSASDQSSAAGMTAGTAQTTFRATRAHGANKLLYGLSVILHTPGIWQLRATVQADGATTEVNCTLPVESPAGRFSGLWLCLALPPVFVGLFFVNQWLRRRQKVLVLSV